MSAHTPGPWLAVANDHYWEIRTFDEQIGDACASKYLTAGDNGEANARLIAAAPELLEALQEIVDYSGGAQNALEDEYVMDRVCAAIAKATGVVP